jgi:hypothetical protein
MDSIQLFAKSAICRFLCRDYNGTLLFTWNSYTPNVISEGTPTEILVMSLTAKECLLRASFYANQAECEGDPEMKAFLRDLSASWKRDAGESRFDRNVTEEPPLTKR